MVHAIQTGKFHGRASKHLRDTASSMSKQDAKDFASTKHEGLPEHVKDAMQKLSNCTTHDPNIPESFDARQKPIEVKARMKGYALAAKKAGLTPGQAFELLCKKAMPSWMEPYSPQAGDISASFLSLPAVNSLVGAGLGAGAGGLGGYLAGRNTAQPEHDHRYRDALLGGLGGAAAGGAAGGLGTLGVLANKHPEIFHRVLSGMVAPQQ